MSDAPTQNGGNGNGHKLSSMLAQSEMVTAFSRMIMMIGTPAAIAIMSWIGNSIVDLRTETARLEERVVSISEDTKARDSRFDSLNRMFGDVQSRIGRLEQREVDRRRPDEATAR